MNKGSYRLVRNPLPGWYFQTFPYPSSITRVIRTDVLKTRRVSLKNPGSRNYFIHLETGNLQTNGAPARYMPYKHMSILAKLHNKVPSPSNFVMSCHHVSSDLFHKSKKILPSKGHQRLRKMWRRIPFPHGRRWRSAKPQQWKTWLQLGGCDLWPWDYLGDL